MTATTPDAGPSKVSREDETVIALLIVAAFTVILNETVMGVAIPHLMSDLGITAVQAQWLTTAFLLTMAVVIPVTGFILQRFSTRAVFIAAAGLFVAGTALASVAPGFVVLLAARVVQASGTAIMLPLLMTTVMTLVPVAERGRRMGNITVVIAVAPAIGPAISGLILSQLNWRFMFVFVLPVAITVLVLGLMKMRTVNEPRHTSVDLLSVPLAALGFGGLVYGLSLFGEGPDALNPAAIAATLTLGVLSLAAFVSRQLVLQRSDSALLDLRTLKVRTYAMSVLLFMTSMAALFGTIILLPLFTQNVLGMSVFASGLLVLPGGLTMGLCAPLGGRAYDRVGARPLIVPGTALVAASLWLLAISATPTVAWPVLLAAHVMFSAGLALVFTPLFSASLGSLPKHLYSHGSATITTVQQVAGAAGTAAFISAMAIVTLSQVDGGATEVVAQAAGIRVAFTIGAVIATAAIGIAALMPRTAAAHVPAEAEPAH